jgi:hypothetical protein
MLSEIRRDILVGLGGVPFYISVPVDNAEGSNYFLRVVDFTLGDTKYGNRDIQRLQCTTGAIENMGTSQHLSVVLAQSYT